MAKKRVVKETNPLTGKKVFDALVLEKDAVCPECGNEEVNKGKILDYGLTSDGKYYYFLKLCSCGTIVKIIKDGDFDIVSLNNKNTKKEEVKTDAVKKKKKFKKAGNIFDDVDSVDI